MPTLRAITGFQLTSADARSLAGFYQEGLGFEAAPLEKLPADELELLGVPGSGSRVLLRLGAQRIELQTFESAGRGYPAAATAADLIFQHLAIVTRDASRAWERVRARGAKPISRSGAVTLPPSDGGVTAVKFRDPEGHPLELIEFPHGSSRGEGALGIDHSAICVADLEAMRAFFADRGLSIGSSTVNDGPTQDALDALDGVKVDVVPLSPSVRSPHLELLRYRAPPGRPLSPLAANDIAATRIVWQADVDALVSDPTGHLHLLRR